MYFRQIAVIRTGLFRPNIMASEEKAFYLTRRTLKKQNHTHIECDRLKYFTIGTYLISIYIKALTNKNLILSVAFTSNGVLGVVVKVIQTYRYHFQIDLL